MPAVAGRQLYAQAIGMPTGPVTGPGARAAYMQATGQMGMMGGGAMAMNPQMVQARAMPGVMPGVQMAAPMGVMGGGAVRGVPTMGDRNGDGVPDVMQGGGGMGMMGGGAMAMSMGRPAR